MPKSLYVDPRETRAPATIHFEDIQGNRLDSACTQASFHLCP